MPNELTELLKLGATHFMTKSAVPNVLTWRRQLKSIILFSLSGLLFFIAFVVSLIAFYQFLAAEFFEPYVATIMIAIVTLFIGAIFYIVGFFALRRAKLLARARALEIERDAHVNLEKAVLDAVANLDAPIRNHPLTSLGVAVATGALAGRKVS